MGAVTDDPSIQFGRFVVVDRPTVSPGNCVVCGYADAGRKYIDFRLDFEFYGSVYLCSDCMVDAGSTLGFATPEKYDAALDTIKAQNEIIEELRESLRLSEQTVDVLSQRRLSDRARSNADSVVATADDSGEVEPEDYRHVKPPVATLSEPESGPAKSTGKQGPDDSGKSLGDLLDL